MANGKDVAKQLRGGKRGGIPWMVILDGEGGQLVTSDGPKGNIGCPIQPHEREFFYEMLAKTKKHMSDDDASAVKAGLEAFAKVILDKRRR